MREQPLPDTSAIFDEVANRADGIARFSVLDMTFADACDPIGIAVEVADCAPDLVGRLVKDGAVINSRYRRSP